MKRTKHFAPELINQGLRRCKHESSYFRGRYKKYGRYQWDIKYYGFQSNYEIEAARLWCLGDHVKIVINPINGKSLYGFEYLNEIIGRPVEASIAGRSGGWLVIDTELTNAELTKVDEYVESCLKALPEFLREEREYHASYENHE